MNFCGFSQYQTKTKLLLGAVAFLIVIKLAFIIYGCFFFTAPEIRILALGSVLTLLPFAAAAFLAYQIHNRRLEKKTEELSEAARIHLATVEALATAIDARDQIGVGHVRRTQIYAIGIGKKLELPQPQIDALEMGALLHDIGKLAVPDHILNKPGRLTPAELEKAKIHSTVGSSILEKVGFAYPVVPTVKYHREMWNGRGYPEGLKTEEIPLTARILAVAETYDTLRGARPYRKAIPRDEARKILLNGSGSQFDPAIVDIFLRNLRNFEMEIEKHGLSYVSDDKEHAENMDIAEHRNGQTYVEQIKSANREVFKLYEVARVFSSALNLDETLSLFTKKVAEMIRFDTCAVYLLDETKENAAIVYAEGKNSALLKSKSIKVGTGETGQVISSRTAVQNIDPTPDFAAAQIDLEEKYASLLALPLTAGNQLIGAISLYSYGADAFGEEHLRLLEAVSRIASNAIGKSLQHTETEIRALTDPMTGLPNARSLQAQFEKEAARAGRKENAFQVLMLDLDGFKAINDTFGHKVGDRMLKGVAKAMKKQLRDYDFLARYAGDEFVAIIPETESRDVHELCRRLEKSVLGFRLKLAENKYASVGVSIGTAGYPQSGSSFDQIVAAADKAMYRVKSARKQQKTKQKIEQQQAVRPVERFVVPVKIIEPPAPRIEPILVHPLVEKESAPKLPEENFLVEVDETHIVSSAVN